MIKIFSPTDKLFSSNGDIVIQPLKAKVHKESIIQPHNEGRASRK